MNYSGDSTPHPAKKKKKKKKKAQDIQLAEIRAVLAAAEP